jgi:hypothetical protein
MADRTGRNALGRSGLVRLQQAPAPARATACVREEAPSVALGELTVGDHGERILMAHPRHRPGER